MKLTPIFAQEFRTRIQQPYKQSDMFQYSQDTKDIVDVETRNVYGISVPEAQIQMQAQLKKVIVRSHTKMQMSVQAIADFLDVDTQTVEKVLLEEKLIKP